MEYRGAEKALDEDLGKRWRHCVACLPTRGTLYRAAIEGYDRGSSSCELKTYKRWVAEFVPPVEKMCKIILGGAVPDKEALRTRLLVVEVYVYRLFLMRWIGTLALSQGIEHHDSLFEDRGAYKDAEGAFKQKTRAFEVMQRYQTVHSAVCLHTTPSELQSGMDCSGSAFRGV